MSVRRRATAAKKTGLAALALAFIWTGQRGAASAEVLVRAPDPAQPVCVTAHVDVLAEHTAQALAAILAYIRATRREPGVVQVQAMQELRPNHFDLVEEWRDQPSYQAHTASPASIHFHDTIAPWRGSPFEERLGTPIAP